MAVQIILKNSSVEDKHPTPTQLANGELALNYNEAGAFLSCRDSAGNIQQVGGVKIEENAPLNPVKNTQWLKPSTLTLFIYDGTSWLPLSGGGGGGGDIVNVIGGEDICRAPAGALQISSIRMERFLSISMKQLLLLRKTQHQISKRITSGLIHQQAKHMLDTKIPVVMRFGSQ